jgi:hypothetical protein
MDIVTMNLSAADRMSINGINDVILAQLGVEILWSSRVVARP